MHIFISDSSVLGLNYHIPDKKQNDNKGNVSVDHRIPFSEIEPDVSRQSRQRHENTGASLTALAIVDVRPLVQYWRYLLSVYV